MKISLEHNIGNFYINPYCSARNSDLINFSIHSAKCFYLRKDTVFFQLLRISLVFQVQYHYKITCYSPLTGFRFHRHCISHLCSTCCRQSSRWCTYYYQHTTTRPTSLAFRKDNTMLHGFCHQTENQITGVQCPVANGGIDLLMNCKPDIHSSATAMALNNWYARQRRIRA